MGTDGMDTEGMDTEGMDTEGMDAEGMDTGGIGPRLCSTALRRAQSPFGHVSSAVPSPLTIAI
jgi:hypothetical protein